MLQCVLIFTGIFYAVVRHISVLYIDNKDSAFLLPPPSPPTTPPPPHTHTLSPHPYPSNDPTPHSPPPSHLPPNPPPPHLLPLPLRYADNISTQCFSRVHQTVMLKMTERYPSVSFGQMASTVVDLWPDCSARHRPDCVESFGHHRIRPQFCFLRVRKRARVAAL